MKNRNNFTARVPLLLFSAFLAAQFARAAEPQIPPQAQTLHARLAPALKPAAREWVSSEAKKVSANPKLNEAIVKADIRTRFAGQRLGDADIEALAFLVMMEATKDANEDLKSIMAETKATNEKKAAQRQAVGNLKKDEAGIKAAARQEAARPVTTNLQVRPGLVKLQSVDQAADNAKAKLDSKSELGETESLRLQMAMDRRSKAIETLSNLMKKVSETSSNIVSNLK